MKKILTLSLSLVLAFSLSVCAFGDEEVFDPTLTIRQDGDTNPDPEVEQLVNAVSFDAWGVWGITAAIPADTIAARM